jgi:hypothetical protein
MDGRPAGRQGCVVTVRDSSIEAFHDHVESGKFSRQQRQILAAMQPGQFYSRLEISELSGIRLSSVCGAVNALVKRGVLVEGSKRPCVITGVNINPVARRGAA